MPFEGMMIKKPYNSNKPLFILGERGIPRGLVIAQRTNPPFLVEDPEHPDKFKRYSVHKTLNDAYARWYEIHNWDLVQLSDFNTDDWRFVSIKSNPNNPKIKLFTILNLRTFKTKSFTSVLFQKALKDFPIEEVFDNVQAYTGASVKRPVTVFSRNADGKIISVEFESVREATRVTGITGRTIRDSDYNYYGRYQQYLPEHIELAKKVQTLWQGNANSLNSSLIYKYSKLTYNFRYWQNLQLKLGRI